MTRSHPLAISIALGAAINLAGCSILYPMPHARDPETGHYECPIGHPIRATIGVVATSVLAASAFYAAAHYTPPPPNMYGYPTGIDVGAGFYRVVGWTLVAAAVVETLGAIDSWSKHAQCTHLEENEARAAATGSKPATPDPEFANLVKTAKGRAAAGDCKTVRVIAARVSDLDPEYYKTVFAVDPALAACDLP